MKIRNFRWDDEVNRKLDWLASEKGASRTKLLIGLIQAEYSVRQRDALPTNESALHLSMKAEASK